MTILALIFGAWSLYLVGYFVGRSRGYEDGMNTSWRIHEVTIQQTAEGVNKLLFTVKEEGE